MNELRPPFGKVTHREREPHRQAHELSQIFADHHLRLNAQLESALAEDPEHLEIRRGGGFLQASRMLADFVNVPRSMADIYLFDEELSDRVEMANTPASDDYDGWDNHRRLHDQPRPLVSDMRPLQAAVRKLQFQESRVLANMIVDIAARYEPTPHDQVLFGQNPKARFAADVPYIGSCTTAETYFLEFGYQESTFKWRGGEGGYMNVIVDDAGNPLMLEKIGIGDAHSALTVQEVVMNNVRLPAGTFLAVGYNATVVDKQPFPDTGYHKQRYVKGNAGIIKASECGGFKYLRLSSLVVEPERRPQALAYLLQMQREAFFPHAEHAEIDVLYLCALKMLDHPEQVAEQERYFEKINTIRRAKGWDQL